MVEASCPVCEGEAAGKFQVDGFPVRECLECRHQFLDMIAPPDHVARIYNDSYFFDGGAGYPGYLREREILRSRGARYAEIVNRHMPAGEVLDVGCAAGFILAGFLDKGWKATGVEPNRTMAEEGRRLGSNIICASFESVRIDGKFDLVTMIQLIAHLAHPKLALKKAASLLRPGGHLLIESWNAESWTARLLGKGWHVYSPPSVLQFFTEGSVNKLVTECGFEAVASGRAPGKFLTAHHAKSLLRYKAKSSGLLRMLGAAAELVPDQLKIPYPSEDLFWALYKFYKNV
jgi:SAM-dependent methyltransferase